MNPILKVSSDCANAGNATHIESRALSRLLLFNMLSPWLLSLNFSTDYFA
jgi:hypothetical protein